jgi:hypothetical protein
MNEMTPDDLTPEPIPPQEVSYTEGSGIVVVRDGRVNQHASYWWREYVLVAASPTSGVRLFRARIARADGLARLLVNETVKDQVAEHRLIGDSLTVEIQARSGKDPHAAEEGNEQRTFMRSPRRDEGDPEGRWVVPPTEFDAGETIATGGDVHFLRYVAQTIAEYLDPTMS